MRLSAVGFRDKATEDRFQAAFDADLRVLTRGTSSILVVLAAIAAFAHGEGAMAFGYSSATISTAVTLPLCMLAVVETLIPMPPALRQGLAGLTLAAAFASAAAAFSYQIARPDGAGLFAAPLAVVMTGIIAAGGFTALVAALVGALLAAAPLALIRDGGGGEAAAVALIAFALAWMIGASIALLVERLKRAQFVAEGAAQAEASKAGALVSAMLPEFAAVRLKAGEQRVAQSFQNIGVLFADLAGFTQMSGRLGASKTVAVLDDIFTAFDDAAARHGLERVKTMGDGYMAVANKNRTAPNDLRPLADFALEIQSIATDAAARHGLALGLRVGIHCGPAIGGVIGRHRPQFDYWGETINIASRLEGQGKTGDIIVSPQVHARLRLTHAFAPGGSATLKGVGAIDIHKLTGRADPNAHTQPAPQAQQTQA